MSDRQRGPARSALSWVGGWLAVIVPVALVALLLHAFVVQAYYVPTGSMEPTIEVGDQVFGQKVTLELGQGPEAGEIVVFDNPSPDASASGEDYLVKRVIATAGQTVDLRDGDVYVDGERLDEPYAAGESLALPTQAAGAVVSFPYTVPEGCVWVMGDNRENSADSRYFGAVSEDDLVAVVFVRYWPLDRIGAL